MTTEQIRKNAPEGSTSYIILNNSDVYYCKVIGKQLHTFDGDTKTWMPLYGYINPKPL